MMRARSGSILARGREVIRIEAESVKGLIPRLGKDFERAVGFMVACQGRVIVTGMGKAGHIGQKISATMASIGTPSYWVHPAEAIHGDMGRITRQDLVIALSNSGETEELTRLLPILKRVGTRIIAVTARVDSTLAKHSDAVLDVHVRREACAMNLAPTSSTAAMLAMGDALAVVVSEEKGFKPKDFALLHPGGALGRRLLLRVRDIMRTGRSHPVVSETTKIRSVLLAITKARAGSASVVDRHGRLTGIFTDGDLRRHLDSEGLINKEVRHAMTRRPKTIREDRLAEEALQLLREYRIDELVVINRKGAPAGLLDVQDLLKAGFV